MKYEDLILISNPYTVYTKFKKIYPPDSDIKISTRKKKKYMIWNPHNETWVHFGSMMQDYTFHRNLQRRTNFLRRNKKWAESDIYTPAYSSYTLLW